MGVAFLNHFTDIGILTENAENVIAVYAPDISSESISLIRNQTAVFTKEYVCKEFPRKIRSVNVKLISKSSGNSSGIYSTATYTIYNFPKSRAQYDEKNISQVLKSLDNFELYRTQNTPHYKNGTDGGATCRYDYSLLMNVGEYTIKTILTISFYQVYLTYDFSILNKYNIPGQPGPMYFGVEFE